MRTRLILVMAIAAAGCSSDQPGTRIPGYLATDTCSGYTDEAACLAAAGCSWMSLGIPCVEGEPCVTGVCVTPDPCRDHGDMASCEAAGCAWAAVELCPPPGDDCPDGFCYTPGDDGCACVCPAYCPMGEDCPPCDCDCTGGGGGGTCTCACPDCPAGEVCPPCGCDCGGTGCADEGTCTCVCPTCPPGTTCPPCECGCDTAGGTGGTSTCECEACMPGETCPPCACDGGSDPCLDHTDEAACLADTTDNCTWIAIGAPCIEGEPCISGVCQNADTIGGGTGGGCACICPDCPPDTECLPCDCADVGAGVPPSP